MTPAALWLILCWAVLASGARLPESDETPYPVQQSPGLLEEPVQGNRRRDLDSSHSSEPTRGAEMDEAAGNQVDMNSHEPSSPVEGVIEGAMLGGSNDNTLGDGNSNTSSGVDEEEYNASAGFNVDDDRFEEYLYYDDGDLYVDGEDNNNGDDDDGEDNENMLYWYDSKALLGQITNCSDIGGGFQLCFQEYVEDAGGNYERIHRGGNDTSRLDLDTPWDLRNNDYGEAKDYGDDDDDDDSDDDSDGTPVDGKNEEPHRKNLLHLVNSFPVLVSNDRLKPDLYFLDSFPTMIEGDLINDESTASKELNHENGSIFGTASREQSKEFEHDAEDILPANKSSESMTGTLLGQDLNFTTSDHKTSFEELYDLVMHSGQMNDEEKQQITSLERLRRHVNSLGGLENLHSKSMVHHIVKRQLSDTEACAVLSRRRRRAVGEVDSRGLRSKRGIGNVGRSLEQGNPRVRQLFNQYKTMCDFISLTVFEK